MAYWSERLAERGRVFGFAAGILFLLIGIFWLGSERWLAWKQAEQPTWLRLLLFGFLFLLGWGRMTQEIQLRPVETFLLAQEKNGKTAQEMKLSARGILKEISEQNGYVTLQLSDVQLFAEAGADGSEPDFQEKRILVSAKRELFPKTLPLCGSRAEVFGKAERLKQARNPGGFDAWLFYRGKKIAVKIKADTLCFSDAAVRPADAYADRFRRWGRKALSAVSCEADRGIFQAILLGDKSELSEETEKAFQRNGIAHILAVSGLHVSLIGMSVWKGLRFLGLGYGSAGAAASLLLLFYGSVTGFGASVFRAIGMALAGFLAKWLGRTYDLLSAMALSLFLLAFSSPLLLCSGGLQLSYAAVLAVGLLNGKGSVWVSLSIQLLTLPLLLFHFFEFPIWGMLLNTLVLPLLSYAAAAGIFGMLLFALSQWLPFGAALFLPAARAAVGPGHYIFWLYRELCLRAEQLPFSLLTSGKPELWKMIVYYAACFLLYRSRKQILPFVLSLVLLCTKPVHGLQLWFLDVGQGDCVCMQTRAGTILSDCGSSQKKQVGKQILSPFLKSQGIRMLDYVLVSHSDADHINGILWLLEEERDISVKRLLLPIAGLGQETYQRLCEAARKRGTEIFYLQAGDALRLGSKNEQLLLECLHPSQGNKDSSGVKLDPNAHSLVLEVNYQAFSLLLTGDIGAAEEKKLIDGLTERYQKKNHALSVLKAAHHGSAGSSSAEFLEAVQPRLTVLSYGEGNSYGHPALEAVERLQKTGTRIWETAKSGAIHVSVDGIKWRIDGFFRE